MRAALLGFAAGTAYLQTRSSLPLVWQMLACGIGALALLWLLRGSVRAACAGALLGFVWAAMLAHLALRPQLAQQHEGRDIDVVGTVASLPHDFGQGLRFQFAVEQVLTADLSVPPRLALSWYRGASDAPSLRPGERWRLRLRLQRPHGNANPHGFDYEVWLLGQGVRATGYIRADTSNRRLAGFVWTPANLVERARALLRSRINAALAGRPYAGVITALVIGEQRGIDQSDWEVFNRTGISHLVAISGLHITMVAALAALITSALWRRSFFTNAELPLLLPTQKVAALSGALAALVYVLLAGFGVPAQRTLYMLILVAAALWSGRLTGVSHILALALGVVLLFDPWAVLWPGFWLSFGAVGVILYAGLGRHHANRGWRAGLQLAARTQYAVTLGLVPLTMLLFAQVSLVGPLANALAIPLVSFVVTPLALAGSMLPAPLSTWLLWAAEATMGMLAQLLSVLARLPLAVWQAPVPPAWLFVLALLGAVWMLAPRGWPLRWAGAAVWLPLLLLQPSAPPPGHLRVTAFDVGQGNALLIETAQHRLLYDTGPRYGQDQDAAARVVLPYLRGRGIARLDRLIVSHADLDHAGGAERLLAALPVTDVFSSLGPAHPIVTAAPTHQRCAAGQRWEWDGVLFEMLQPSALSYDQPGLKPNARSCTLRISAHGHAMLLAGDIEAAQEAALLAQAPEALRADVLLAPHHGSGTSSTPAFLTAVAPRYAVFQVGHRNRYRHPQAAVYARYGERGIERLRTDEAGALVFEFGLGLRVSRYRVVHGRYWHDRITQHRSDD